MKRMVSLFLTALLLSLAGFAAADIPDKPDAYAYAYDFTGNTLADSALKNIKKYGTALEERTGVQAIAVVVNFLDGADPADYATDLINEWGIGSEMENDGVVLLLARGDRAIQIGTGSGIDRILTGSQCGRLIDKNIDAFAQNRFSDGMMALYEDVSSYIADAYRRDGKLLPAGAGKVQTVTDKAKTVLKRFSPEDAATALIAGGGLLGMIAALGYMAHCVHKGKRDVRGMQAEISHDPPEEAGEDETLWDAMAASAEQYRLFDAVSELSREKSSGDAAPEKSSWNEGQYEEYRSAANRGKPTYTSYTPPSSYTGSPSYGSSNSNKSSYTGGSSYSSGSSYRSSYTGSSSYGSSSSNKSSYSSRKRSGSLFGSSSPKSKSSFGGSSKSSSSGSSRSSYGSSRSSFGGGSSRGGGVGRSFGSSSSSRSSFGSSSRSSASKSSSRSFGGGKSRGGGGGRSF